MSEYPNIDRTRNWRNLDPSQDPARSGHGRESDYPPPPSSRGLSRLLSAWWAPYAVIGVIVVALIVIVLVGT